MLEMPIPGDEGAGEGYAATLGDAAIPRLRDWPGDRHDRDQEVVVMRRLNLSERRDSFKKQEAVQEVSFDEPELAASSEGQDESKPLTAWRRSTHTASWVEDRPGRSPLAADPKPPSVPHIAVQREESAGSTTEQGPYPVHLEARVYIEQEDGTTAIEYKSVSSQRQGSWEQKESSPTLGAGHRTSSGEKAMDSPSVLPRAQLASKGPVRASLNSGQGPRKALEED